MAQRPPGALAGVASYVDTPPGGCIYSDEFSGAVAQLGERRAGSAEVRGSIPLGSTLRSGLPVGNTGKKEGPRAQRGAYYTNYYTNALRKCLFHSCNSAILHVRQDGRVGIERDSYASVA